MPRLTRRQPVASAALERLGVADAAAHLDLDVEPADDAGEQLGVGAAAEGGVEVDQVQPLGALLLPGQGGLDRVAELAPGAGDALHELHGAAARRRRRRAGAPAGAASVMRAPRVGVQPAGSGQRSGRLPRRTVRRAV